MNETTLLLDSDIIAYKFAASNQIMIDFDGTGVDSMPLVTPLDQVMNEVDTYINELMRTLKADDYIVCLSCHSADNWRKKVLPSYKENRKDVIPPVLLSHIKGEMRMKYQCYERPTLEADDIMGILSTHPALIPGKKIIVSEDKDMKTIPGWLFNPRKDEKPVYITEDEADYTHLYQALMGDATDGYKGCPGIGPKKAEKILNGEEGELIPMWDRVVAAYVSKGLTEEDALVQARVARICRVTEYDFKAKEVKLWMPEKS